MLRNRDTFLLLGLAVLLTLLNALKPPRIDDTFYIFFAQQIALYPLDPGGFELHWFEWPIRASDWLAPPLLIYWLAGAIELFGEQPVLWKLSLLPFALVLVFSLHSLCRRFAPGIEIPLVSFITLSPAFLPSFNLMLDVPAEALIFASLAVFILASEKQALWLAVLAGLLAGLAMLTKYTGVIAPAAIMLYALIFGRVRLAILGCGLSAAIFLGWEFVTYLMYGRSQFLFTFLNLYTEPWTKLQLAEALLKTLGAIHVAIVVLVLAAWAAPRWLLGLVVVMILSGYAIIAYQPAQDAVFSAYGATIVLAIFAACLKLMGQSGAESWWRALWQERRQECFLVGLLLLEVAAFFVITPFGAVRRLLGLTVVSTLVAGRLVMLSAPSSSCRRVLWGVAAFNIMLGMGFYAIDFREAQAFKLGVEHTASTIDSHAPEATVWYLGRWGFQYHAERKDMQPLVPEYSRVRAGDWIVMPDRASASAIDADASAVELIDTITVDDPVNLTTHPIYYAGFMPLEHRNQPRLQARLYRARTDFIPRTGRDPETVAIWAKQYRDTSAALMPMPALLRGLEHQNPRYRYFTAEALGLLGPRAANARQALQAHLRDPDPRVRGAVTRALEKIDIME